MVSQILNFFMVVMGDSMTRVITFYVQISSVIERP